jgi:hypothetical protein
LEASQLHHSIKSHGGLHLKYIVNL